MTDLQEQTELFASFAMSETEYREALRAAGCCDWLENALVSQGFEARAQSMKHDRETVYS